MKDYRLGIDIGSTTVKLVVLSEDGQLLYNDYRRHFSDMKETLITLVRECYQALGDIGVRISITGSGGLSVS